jgi:hypothetical protein
MNMTIEGLTKPAREQLPPQNCVYDNCRKQSNEGYPKA